MDSMETKKKVVTAVIHIVLNSGVNHDAGSVFVDDTDGI